MGDNRGFESQLLLNRRLAVSWCYAVSTALYLGTSERNASPIKVLSCSFSARCSLSFSETAEDERAGIKWEAPYSWILFILSKRECEPEDIASVTTIIEKLAYVR